MPLLPLLLASTTLLPGLWEYQSSFAGMGGKVEQKCLTTAEVERFLTDPSNKRYACDMSTQEVGAGRVRLKGVCTSRKHAEQKVGVSLSGTYTPETLSMKGTASARLVGNLELPVGASVTAHRLAASCAAGASPPAPATTAPPASGASDAAPHG